MGSEGWIIVFMYLANASVLGMAFLAGFQGRRTYSVLWGGLFLFHMASFPRIVSLLSEFGFNTMFWGQGLMFIANNLLFLATSVFDRFTLRGVVEGANLQSWLIRPSPLKRRYFILILVVTLVSIALQLGSGLERFLMDWETRRESGNIVDSLANMLCFIVFPSVWVAFRSRWYVLAFLLGLFLLGISQSIGSRAALLTFLAAGYTDLLQANTTLRKKLSVLVLVALLGFGLHTLLRLTRGLGPTGIFHIITSGEITTYIKAISWGSIDLSGGESDIYRYYNYIIDKHYDDYPYQAWITIKRLFLLYVPTSWAPDIKPTDITYQFWSDALVDAMFDTDTYYDRLITLMDAGQTGSLHPTLWGDAYANGGVAALLIYPIGIGFLLVLIEKYTRKLNPSGIWLVLPLIDVGYLMVARGNVVIGFGYLGYIIPMALVLGHIARLHVIVHEDRGNLK